MSAEPVAIQILKCEVQNDWFFFISGDTKYISVSHPIQTMQLTAAFVFVVLFVQAMYLACYGEFRINFSLYINEICDYGHFIHSSGPSSHSNWQAAHFHWNIELSWMWRHGHEWRGGRGDIWRQPNDVIDLLSDITGLSTTCHRSVVYWMTLRLPSQLQRMLVVSLNS